MSKTFLQILQQEHAAGFNMVDMCATILELKDDGARVVICGSEYTVDGDSLDLVGDFDPPKEPIPQRWKPEEL